MKADRLLVFLYGLIVVDSSSVSMASTSLRKAKPGDFMRWKTAS
jgi:hypothetical protein